MTRKNKTKSNILNIFHCPHRKQESKRYVKNVRFVSTARGVIHFIGEFAALSSFPSCTRVPQNQSRPT
jgi:hypothetical protein